MASNYTKFSRGSPRSTPVTISSRTPEGMPNRCPICRNSITIVPSPLFGDAPCPHCGSLLWFLAVGGEARYFPAAAGQGIRERLIAFVASQLGVRRAAVRADPIAFLADLGADSLDIVELVMELEMEEESG